MGTSIDIPGQLQAALRDKFEVRFNFRSLLNDAEKHPRIAALASSVEEPLTVVIAREVEVRPHGILLDRSLGTLALIQICEGSGDSAAQQRVVEQVCHDAIHVRQVLRHDARKGQAYEKSSFGVELVLVVPSHSDDGESASASSPLAEIAETLRAIMARSGFLHTIGVSVLPVATHHGRAKGKAGQNAFNASDLRRAFPWLLKDVQTWLEEQQPGVETDPAAPMVLRSIELEDFRVAGSRIWAPFDAGGDDKLSKEQADQRLHLMHGANGSGKSSFTEAVELALTDRVDRLEDAPGRTLSYREVLTNRKRRTEARPGEPEPVATVRLKVQKPEADPQGPRTTLTCRVGKAVGESEIEVEGDASDRGNYRERLRGSRDRSRFLDAGSFRLDQVFIDKMIHFTPGQRASLFLKAFFQDRTERVDAIGEPLNRFHDLWETLPEMARRELRKSGRNPEPEQAIGRVGQLLAEKRPLADFMKWSGLNCSLDELVPDSLAPLKAHWPASLLKSLSADVPSSHRANRLARLDEAFAATAHDARARLQSCETALPLLESLNQWEAHSEDGGGTLEEFAKHLNDWLDRHADWDLAEKSRQLVETRLLLETDREADAEAAADQSIIRHVAVSSDEAVEELRTRLDELNDSVRRLDDHREAAHRQVLEFRLSDSGSAETLTSRPHLSTATLHALDEILPTLGDTPLSAIVRQAVDSLKPEAAVVDIGHEGGLSIQVGHPGGLTALIEQLKHQQADLQKLISRIESRETEFADIPNKLQGLQTAAEACATAEVKAVEQLNKLIAGSLKNALNELVALLTPARWAYRDVVADGGFGKRGSQLNFVLPSESPNNGAGQKKGAEGVEIPVWLMFNTAELNTFVLGLFLLCTPKLDNPLRLLILDDPFQNMDELTVTTIARGIGRLMRLWERAGQPAGAGMPFWNLLVLVHGEGTMNRIRSEVACSASYLPWQQPKELDARTGELPDDSDKQFDQVETDLSLLSRELADPSDQIDIVSGNMLMDAPSQPGSD